MILISCNEICWRKEIGEFQWGQIRWHQCGKWNREAFFWLILKRLITLSKNLMKKAIVVGNNFQEDLASCLSKWKGKSLETVIRASDVTSSIEMSPYAVRYNLKESAYQRRVARKQPLIQRLTGRGILNTSTENSKWGTYSILVPNIVYLSWVSN